MIDASTMAAILDSFKNPVMFVDTEHVIRYMNKAAVAHYKGGEALPGTSVLDCHNERSCEVIGYYERYAPPGRKLNVEHGPSKD